jgi:hypothetical protein
VIKLCALILFVSCSLAFSQPLQMPAKQVSAVDGNNTSEYITISGSTAQLIFDNLELVTTNLYTQTGAPLVDTDRTDDLSTNVILLAPSLYGSITVTNQELNISFPQNVTNTAVGATTSGGALTISNGLLTVQFPPDYTSPISGPISGVTPVYLNTSQITITAGYGQAYDTDFTLAADATHTMTSLAAGADQHYIYIDYSASTFPASPAFIDSTTEPTFDVARQGWYKATNDRCIGVVYSDDGLATVIPFVLTPISDTVQDINVLALSTNTTRIEYNDNTNSIGNNALWQIPNTELSTVVPVNAIGATLMLSTGNGANFAGMFVTTKEFADIDNPPTLYLLDFSIPGAEDEMYPPAATFGHNGDGGVDGTDDTWAVWGYTPLGPSRNIRFLQTDYAHERRIQVFGWRIQR